MLPTEHVSQRLADLKNFKHRLSIIEGGIEGKDKSFDLNVRLRGSGQFTAIPVDREIVVEWMNLQKIQLETHIKNLSDAIDRCAEALGYKKPDPSDF